ncbi:MAG TPA: hypothetical protein VEH04_04230 [Verrucomicrobiae bacterium]|nr:hypothetical protein [Verrucomicrobiae bacterium]
MARGSLNETKHFLRRAFRGLLKRADTGVLKPMLDELAPKLINYIRSIGRCAVEPQADNNKQLTTNNEQKLTTHLRRCRPPGREQTRRPRLSSDKG